MAVTGYIDVFTGSECAGWVADDSDPREALSVCLIVNGQERHIEAANLERNDLKARFPDTRHGFSFGLTNFLDPGKNTLRIVVKGHDFTFENDAIIYDPREDSSFVEKGREGWLFLQNDSNKTSELISGKYPLSDAAAKKIVARYANLSAYFADNNIKTILYFVPEKGVVCNQFRKYPLQLSNNRPVVQLIDEATRQNVSGIRYGVDDLQKLKRPESSYLKVDTHPSPAGQIVFFKSLLLQLGLKFTGKIVTEDIATFQGDLGSKLEPQRSVSIKSKRPIFSTAHLIDEVTPGIELGTRRLTGLRSYHRNDSGNGRCVLFGTSSAYYMREFFYSTFYETFYFWTAQMSVSVVDTLKPDFLVFLVTERVVSENFMSNDAIMLPL